MFTIKAPEAYWNEPGVLARGGELIAPFAGRVWVLAGQTALVKAGGVFLESLAQSGVDYAVRTYGGYCTLEDIELLAAEALEAKAETIIGIGGGRILDTAKAVGDKRKLPVVTVPTVAATCAAWSALSVVYNRQGTHTGGLILEKSPKLVLADTRLLAEAPPRYIAAGIGDTLVKWYEASPNVENGPESIHARAGLLTSKLALDILEELSVDAYRTAGSGEVTDAFTEVANAVIFLAGQAGSWSGGRPRAAVAHAVNNSLTRHHETHVRLHGEKVAFGLIVQLFLEGYSQTKIGSLAHLLHALGLPLTLRELGLTGETAVKASEIAKGVVIHPEAASRLPFKVHAEALEKAILDTDSLGRRITRQEPDAVKQYQAV